jgi:hypothetical protein
LLPFEQAAEIPHQMQMESIEMHGRKTNHPFLEVIAAGFLAAVTRQPPSY